ncbi:NAD(P)H-binding protein [Kocuria sp. KH4]
MSLVVTTPTGHVGSRVVQLLLQAGARPTLLVRDAARLDPAVRARCTVVEGDQGDVEAVLRATAGAEALYWVDPPSLDDDPVAGHARFGTAAEAEVAAALRGLGLTDAQVEGVLGMSRGQRGFVPENPRDVLTTTPTRLGAWASTVLRPALEG